MKNEMNSLDATILAHDMVRRNTTLGARDANSLINDIVTQLMHAYSVGYYNARDDAESEGGF